MNKYSCKICGAYECQRQKCKIENFLTILKAKNEKIKKTLNEIYKIVVTGYCVTDDKEEMNKRLENIQELIETEAKNGM